MKKKNAFKLLAALAAVSCSAASFGQGSYIGGNLAALDFSVDGVSSEASLTAIYGRLGTFFNENLSGEIRAGVGVGDDSIGAFDVDLEHMFGAYVRAGMQATEAFYPYAVIGYTRGEVKVSASGFGSDSDSESDVSFGLGADFSLGQQMTINLEYMNYLDKDGAEIDGFSIGIAKSF